MKCYYPQVKPDIVHPCGVCLPCRINARNARAGRILLESTQWKYNYFVTLTYAPDTIRFNDEHNMVLYKPDLQKFLKRFRRNTGENIKYFAVGEYGDKFQRPHYHLALFTNMEPGRAQIEVSKAWSIKGQSESTSLNYSRQRRLIGLVDCKLLNQNRAQYVAQYTTKKIVSDRSLPDGVPAEFAIMSKHPPLGHRALIMMARRLIRLLENTNPEYRGYVDPQKIMIMKNLQQGCFRLNGRLWPLDRYSKNLILRELTGKDGLSSARRQIALELKRQWTSATAFDINQEAKSRHISLVKTEKWKKKRREACKKSNL